MKKGIHCVRGTKYPYISMFDENSGFYVRTGVLDGRRDTGVDPFMADFPELLDVGIMGNCIHGSRGLCRKAGIDCYQDGLGTHRPDMALEDFKRIVQECSGRTYQIALGGRGDPDQHKDFVEILACCRENSIVPNFTTSGLGMTQEIAEVCRQYCGAVAVSWYRSEYTVNAIRMLLAAGVKTNIHYVLSSRSLAEAIQLLHSGGFPEGINAVVFLLYKPVGLGRKEFIITEDTPGIEEFFNLIDGGKFPFKVGFDSCTIPGILRYSRNTDIVSVDTCEGGRWSAYITPDMFMLPCSFDNQELRWAVSLRECTIEEAWNSELFDNFRSILSGACPECPKRASCMGGCPIRPEVVLCKEKGKKYSVSCY